VPGGSSGNTKLPELVEAAEVFIPVELLIAVTLAFGTTDPLGSDTVPVMEPVPLVWATTAPLEDSNNTLTARTNARTRK
jgi:hypothetical protein